MIATIPNIRFTAYILDATQDSVDAKIGATGGFANHA
jgi:hypothetical protein